LEKLVESAEAIDSWHEPLTLRTDLSARTLRRLASFVGTALLDILATRNGLDDDTRVYLNRRLRSRLQREEQSDAGNDAVREIVAAAQEGRLNDEYMEDLAEAGNKEAVIFALASLAQVPVPTVRRILDSRSGKAVVALVWLARLSMRVAVKIQNFVLKLIPGQSLAARGGKDFPLTEKEMLWQLNYFDVVPAGTRPASET